MRIKWDSDTQDKKQPLTPAQRRVVEALRACLNDVLAGTDPNGQKWFPADADDVPIAVVHNKIKRFYPIASKTFYSFKDARAGRPTTRELLIRIGVPEVRAKSLAEDAYAIFSGGPKAALLPDPALGAIEAALASRVRRSRLDWDRLEGGPAYRDPEMAFDRSELSRALEVTLQGGVFAEEDVAYLIYSAVKHNANYAAWLGVAPQSASVAEALLDLALRAQPDQVRPRLRAAWALQHLETDLRADALKVGLEIVGDSDPALVALLHAVADGEVSSFVRLRAASGFYGPKTESILTMIETEWGEGAIVRDGARGRIAVLRAAREQE